MIINLVTFQDVLHFELKGLADIENYEFTFGYIGSYVYRKVGLLQLISKTCCFSVVKSERYSESYISTAIASAPQCLLTRSVNYYLITYSKARR